MKRKRGEGEKERGEEMYPGGVSFLVGGTETAAGMLFLREIPVAAAAAATGSLTGFVDTEVGTGDVEDGGGVDEVEDDNAFLGDVGGGFSSLLFAPLKVKIRNFAWYYDCLLFTMKL